VFFPAGDYRITRPLYILNSAGVHIYGAGPFSTKIRNSGSTNAVFTASLSAPVAPDYDHSVLTVTAMTSGTIYRGMILSGIGSAVYPVIVGDYGTGAGQTGTYMTSPHPAVASQQWTGLNTTALYLNEVAFSTFEEFHIKAGTGGTAIECDWVLVGDGSPDKGGWASQILLFSHLFLEAGAAGG